MGRGDLLKENKSAFEIVLLILAVYSIIKLGMKVGEFIFHIIN